MSKVTIFFLLIIGLQGTFAYTSAQFPAFSISTSVDTTQVQQEPLANIFSRWLIDTISSKITEITRHFHLKLRIIKFLASLYTTDNLILLRNLTEYAVKIGKLTLRVLPATVDDPGYWWISSVVKFFNNIHVGNGSLIEQFLGPITQASLNRDDITDSESERVEFSTDPPVYFNAPTSQQQADETEAASYDDKNETSQPKATVDDDLSESAARNNEEILSNYEGRIMTLNRLINIKRK